MKELERIADELSRDSTTLDESLGQFERGVALVKTLNAMLDNYEKKIDYIEAASDDDAGNRTEPGQPE